MAFSGIAPSIKMLSTNSMVEYVYIYIYVYIIVYIYTYTNRRAKWIYECIFIHNS